MAKTKTQYVCQVCGATSPKWLGRCPQCGSWNSFTEEIVQEKKTSSSKTVHTSTAPKLLTDIGSQQQTRIDTKIDELNRVLGGGIVPGSLILLGGEPGIGKSTLALQLALQMHFPTLYVSGEESLQQIKMRAERLNFHSEYTYFLAEVSLEAIIQHTKELKPKLVIIDSIQTMQTELLDSSPGTISQIRECTTQLQRFAKENNIAFVIIGHINKEGQIAGPKVLEHIVDTVLQFEGDRNYLFRILRSVKNRFGSTSEIGIFEMHDKGLREVKNPSEILLSPSKEPLSGIAIAATIEGMRPFMIEVQALVGHAVYGTPQRSATGFDTRRMNMLLAVLEKRLGIKLGTKDIFLNIAGGVKVVDPAIDIAVLAAIISSNQDIVIPKDIAFAAEVGLTGEIRPVNRIDQRISEAEKLGFSSIVISKYSKIAKSKHNINIVKISKVTELFAFLMKNS